jgi:hydroxyquinol 1,2-dioxygenase
VKKSLIADFTEIDDPEQARRYGMANPFTAASIDLVLETTHVG